MNSGGEISDSIPIDLVSEIFSRLPAKSVARFRCVSKQWRSMFHHPCFTELFLTRSWARPRLLFVLSRKGGQLSFFSSPQLHNPYGKSSLVVSADFHVRFSCPYFCSLTSGLIYFSRMRITKKNSRPVIFNPRTRQYARLPRLPYLTRDRRINMLGFDPIDKQFKVLSSNLYYLEDQKILTLETGEMSWRRIHCPYYPSSLSEGICINGVLYYFARKTVFEVWCSVIVCFDVRYEKYNFIESEESFKYDTTLINYKGKLGGIKWNYDSHGNTLKLRMWVLGDVEKQEWSKNVYILPANKLVDLRNVSLVGVTAAGEIVLSMYYISKPFYVFYFNPKKNTLQHVEIKGFGEYYEAVDKNRHRVYASVDYVEDLNANDAKYLKSSQCLNIIRERPKPPKPRKP